MPRLLTPISAPSETHPKPRRAIRETLKGQGFSIDLVVNHAAAAASVGLELRPTQVVFASPPRLLERAILARSKTVGIDLPLKFLVYEDESGEVQLFFNDVGYLVDRHDIRLRDIVLLIVDQIIQQFGKLDNGLVTVPSERSVEDTAATIQSVIAGNPAFRIPLVIDFSERWGRHRRHRAPILIVFGNPNAGTPLMQANQQIGVDLPQKFLVWEGRDGQVNITYNDPFFPASRHDIQGQDGRLTAIAGALANFATAGAMDDGN